MKKFGLIGHPLGHSMSERIHHLLFERSGVQAEYKMMDFPQDELEYNIGWAKEHLQGFNCTIPYKQSVIPYLDEVDDRAAFYGAVNTVKNMDGKLKGFNTDWQGFNKALANGKIALKDKNVFVLGTGGVSRIMAFESLLAHARKVIIHSRTFANAEKLVNELNERTGSDRAAVYEAQHADVILNGTPAGMWPRTGEMPLPKEIVQKAEAVFDTIYNPVMTPLLLYARQQKIANENGLSMLVMQAAEAEKIWGIGDFNQGELNDVITRVSGEIGKSFSPNIVLTGFMGSGKTTIGKLLAEKLHYRLIDIDQKIVEKEGKTISDIFDTEGEMYFRNIETEMIQQSVREEGQIIATGGGAVISETNEKIIRQSPCLIIYLETSLSIIIKRLQSCDDRPLIQGKDFIEKTTKLYHERSDRYGESCNIAIDANGDENDIVDEIVRLMAKY